MWRMVVKETISSYIDTTNSIDEKKEEYELSNGFNYDTVNLKISVFDGDYNKLTNKPLGGSGGVTQINSDWNATTGVSAILNKPTIPLGLWTTNITDNTKINYNAGNVGIGIDNPQHRLEVCTGTTGTAGQTCFPLKITAGDFTNLGNGTATLIALGTEVGSFSKCVIGHSRTNSGWDIGSIVFFM